MTFSLIKKDTSKNQQRFYNLHIIPTLFGDWSLVREWGRIGSPGTLKTENFSSEPAATKKMKSLIQQKKKRGYISLKSDPK